MRNLIGIELAAEQSWRSSAAIENKGLPLLRRVKNPECIAAEAQSAASTAFPPFFKTSSAAFDAKGCPVAAIPRPPIATGL
jgi:hypothetical protein